MNTTLTTKIHNLAAEGQTTFTPDDFTEEEVLELAKSGLRYECDRRLRQYFGDGSHLGFTADNCEKIKCVIEGTAPPLLKYFNEFRLDSVKLAQLLISKVLELSPRVKISPHHDRQLKFEPNFIWLENMRCEPPGITISLYGSPAEFRNPLIRHGWGSYSRTTISTPEELTAILPAIKHAYYLKHLKY
jgi:hypothetical protein